MARSSNELDESSHANRLLLACQAPIVILPGETESGSAGEQPDKG